MIIIAAIWLVILTFLCTCVAVIFLNKGAPASKLVLPVATVSAFTQLKSTSQVRLRDSVHVLISSPRCLV
ncbi:hypothetical protein NEOLEDRAFT_1135747 [Neolentinus lepideus HHB14362 ss-1]|uniref:Uncharacterized protein n=1 Tax=Neolentinus lepideus HHB14362 ss-1 TaxID=1314782 RepID=A0A165RJN3_9AGAM|nr:hypothetical protein NEOLEDRAFT_1135747 [Neolentinus lepideus HHB14362 ss-1]